MVRVWNLVVIVVAILLACSLPTMAQESAVKGSLEGVVVDASGASVPGAQVTLDGPEGSKTTVTDNQGIFTFPLLIQGRYNVKVQKQGFKAATLTGVEVITNRVSSLRPALETGAITEPLEVTGWAV